MTQRVLIIEDSPTVATMICYTLEPDYRCEVAGTLEAARAKLIENYNLVILDLILPDSVVESATYEAIQAVTGTPILVFTGLIDPAFVERVVSDGNAFLSKTGVNIENQLRVDVNRFLRAVKRRGDELHHLSELSRALQCLNH